MTDTHLLTEINAYTSQKIANFLLLDSIISEHVKYTTNGTETRMMK